MEHVIFSINATLPVVLLILIGYFLRRIGVMDEPFTTALNRFAYNVTLPFMIYSNLSRIELRSLWDLSYVLLCAAATLVCFAVAAAVSVVLLRRNTALRGEFIQASFRGSAILLAFAFIQSIYGAVTVTSLMVLATVPLYNLLSVIVLSLTGGETGGRLRRDAWRGMLTNLMRNPIIIGIVIGLLGAALQPPLPAVADEVIDTLGSLMTPLALLGLGSSFQGRGAGKYLLPTAVSCLLKLVIFPAMLLPLAVHLGLRGEKLAALLVMVGSPASVSCYVMARNAGHEGVLSSGTIVFSTILSAFTLTFWIYVLRTLGAI